MSEENVLVFLNGYHLEELNQSGGKDYRPILTDAGIWAWLEQAEPGQTTHKVQAVSHDEHHEIHAVKTSSMQKDEVYIE